ATRLQLSVITRYLQARGWRKVGGRPEFAEEYLPPQPNSGAPKRNFVDATFVKNGRVLRIQTVTTDSRGNPTVDEAAAAASIRAKTPGDHLLLIPKEPR